MSAVMARSPAFADFAMYPSATSRPIATRTVETCREDGSRMSLLATKIVLTARRSAARMTMSFTAAGQASASTKIFTGPKVRDSGRVGYLPRARWTPSLQLPRHACGSRPARPSRGPRHLVPLSVLGTPGVLRVLRVLRRLGRPGWPGRAHQLDPPQRAALGERRHRLHERRRVAAQDPDVRVGRDLVEQRGDRACDAGDVHLHQIVHGLAPEAWGREGLLAGGDELQLHEPRLWRDGEHRHRRLRRLREDVLDEGEDHAVRKVVGQLEAVLDHLLLAILGVADLDLAAGTDGRVDRHLERRALLHHVIAHEAEALLLRVDGG